MTIKTMIMILILTSILNAGVIATQNIKALYKGVKLTEIQESYILDNQDNNINIIQNVLNKEIKKLKLKFLDEKNIVSFKLTPTGEINKIKFLKKSDNRKLDRTTKKAINKTIEKFVKPKEMIEMRFILSYRVGQNQISVTDYSNQRQVTTQKEIYYQSISRGTTRFQHSSKEYVRIFETNKDGFINATAINANASMELLTINNQKVRTGYTFWKFNIEVPKGKYKLLIKTKKTCDISLEYL